MGREVCDVTESGHEAVALPPKRDRSGRDRVRLITMPVLVFSGTVDFSRFMYFNTAVAEAARVGAETAIGHCPTAADCRQT
jgi:hypothetical protein